MQPDLPSGRTAPERFSLLLPRTTVPMRPADDHAETTLRAWGQDVGYSAARRALAGAPPFVLHDGPPYANGPVHAGHALNKALKDSLARAHRGMGLNAQFRPGWDCHGLPVEWEVEKAFAAAGRPRSGVGALEMRAACRAHAAGWMTSQAESFRAMGVCADWDDPYSTMAFSSEAAVARSFLALVDRGLVYRAQTPVRWSPAEGTALAEAELEWEEREEDSAWVLYRALSGPLRGSDLLAWTTTPWTLPASAGLGFGRRLSYGLYRVRGSGRSLVCADACAASAAEAAGADLDRERGVSVGELASTSLAHPLNGLDERWSAPLTTVGADHVCDDQGTGLVHLAPAHGPEDAALARLSGWPLRNVVDEDGLMAADTPAFAGLPVTGAGKRRSSASEAVMRALSGLGTLWAAQRVRHPVALSWRSKAPVLYRSTPQWFAAMDLPMRGGPCEGRTLRAVAFEAAASVFWTPESAGARMSAMLKDRPDWLLSRQRAWGVPLPLFVPRDGPGAGSPLRDPAVDARVLSAFASEGADAWYEPGAAERFLGPDRDPERFEQVRDVLDVWFESGCSHSFGPRPEGRPLGELPGPVGELSDLVVEGTDQHRGWFQASLLCGAALWGRAPFRAVRTHGFVLDAKGRKMSKSEGNVRGPAEMAERYGADAVRWWALGSDASTDARAGDQALSEARGALRGLRNTLRFLCGVLTPDEPAHPERFDGPDAWLLGRLAAADERARAAWGRADSPGALRALTKAAGDVGGTWAFMRKDPLYCDPPRSPRRMSALSAAYLAREALLAWAQPCAPLMVAEVVREAGLAAPPARPFPDLGGHARVSSASLDELFAARKACSAALERCRVAGVRPEAQEVMLSPPAGWGGMPDGWSDEDAASLMGVARVLWAPAGSAVCWSAEVRPSPWCWCDRCRSARPDVSAGLCVRCAMAEASLARGYT